MGDEVGTRPFSILASALVIGCACSRAAPPLSGPAVATESPPSSVSTARTARTDAAPATRDPTRYRRPPLAELKSRLTPLQYEVTEEEGTERPFHNEYWNNHEPGIYVDITTGEPLFSSTDKFESGTGWPSFTRPIEDGHVLKRTDVSLGISRDEVRSSGGDAHLGHVFDDGPAPTGLRYCINSASLRFIPVSKLAAGGYGDYARLFEK